ncbi:MAG: 1-acyl-sn-glycerol-3-phosphate acyltransferase [Gammaproteobacteria bacterium]|nr:MAG: 1-acyl-sn-glycerol-3-phosphate acyltransferase [Gammaproteobacteria bacterium]
MKNTIKFIRSLIFWPGFLFSIIAIQLVLMFAWFLPYDKRYRVLRYWNRFVLWWLKVSVNLDYKIIGAENLPNKPVVFMIKHSSTWETIAMTVFLPPLTWILKKSILYIPFFGWGVAAMEPITIDRNKKRTAMKSIVIQGVKKLKNNTNILIFPEGTRVASHEKGTYKKGGAVLAIEAGVDIVPICHNAGLFWPKHKFTKNSGIITVMIGKTIKTAGKNRNTITCEVENWIENTLANL